MINRAVFFDHVRYAPFDGHMEQSQVDGVVALLDAWDATKLSDLRWLGYALATVYHETARTMCPVEEYGHGRGRAYGVPAGPWHEVYDGRGDVQITWETNYAKASTKLKAHGIIVDLVRYPATALRPDVAAAILFWGSVEGWFTGRKLGDYFNEAKADPINARRIINALDCASEIAGYYRSVMAAIAAATAPDLARPDSQTAS